MGAGVGRLALAVTLLAFLSGPDVRAASIVVIGNYPQSNDGTLSAVASLDGTFAKAVGFTMGEQSYDLASVTLRLMEQAGSNSMLSVALFRGTPADPSGPALVRFDSPTIPSLASDVTFTPTTSFELQAGSTYWLEVSGKSDTLNGIVWYASRPGLTPAGLAATSAGARFTDQLGLSSALVTSSVWNTFEVTGLLTAGEVTGSSGTGQDPGSSGTGSLTGSLGTGQDPGSSGTGSVTGSSGTGQDAEPSSAGQTTGSSGAGITSTPEPASLILGTWSAFTALVYACWRARRRAI
jgi:hypothetical protein